MPELHSTREHVGAYRFGVRRLERALTTGQIFATSLHGPRYGLTAAVGTVVGGILLAGAALLGALRPEPSAGGAGVLINSDSGGAYAVINGVAHPSTNYTSALLAASVGGAMPEVKKVNNKAIATIPRGQLVGIPGAPDRLPAGDTLSKNVWTACDVATQDKGRPTGARPTVRNTLVLGEVAPPVSDATQAAIVTPDGESFYLLWNGHRSRIANVNDPVLANVLGISSEKARPISLSLLNLFPAAPNLTRIPVAKKGVPITLGSQKVLVGDVVSAANALGENRFYLVLRNGVAELSPQAADLARFSWSVTRDIVKVPPNELATTPRVKGPRILQSVPDRAVQIPSATDDPVLCWNWSESAQGMSLLKQPPVPEGAHPVPVPPQKGAARTRTADEVYVRPGGGLVAAVSTADGVPSAADRFIVTDQGVAYPLGEAQVASTLGLQERSVAVPGALIQMLPIGAVLDPAAARKVRK